MTATMIYDILTGVFTIIGVFFTVVAAIGLIRLPDIYSRAHAASKSATLGVMFVLFAALLHVWVDQRVFDARLLLGLFFVLLTAPVGGHLIARAAHAQGVKLWDKSLQDALQEDKDKGIE
ncbi:MULTISPECIES: monovalent cation/H(+) antiporter subunit G [Exiguobacterium]|uniref:monovalent cation/H(+) antiporter subunit G n=1 Tax=Exiguobacterium TaxID=33986 RepID=UPI001BEBE9A4|nr:MULTISPECIES: monovalent cation/H(+) antiporter subunit G [Exiguobacterium]MCT4776714.1 monovalent cation/H(+) antiporter subunit G [Exiguobacterium aquaticum]MCT4789835.1 monovalent cation/H(+) antiporter subunit G [Exiguobacterium mexicanum]